MHETVRRLVHSSVAYRLSGAIFLAGTTLDVIHLDPEVRIALGPVIGEYIGNFGPTAIPIVGSVVAGTYLENLARLRDSRALEIVGKLLPYFAITLMYLVNFAIESHFLTDYAKFIENMLDLSVGIFSISNTAVLADNLRPIFLRRLANSSNGPSYE